jgi:hypothetical protein
MHTHIASDSDLQFQRAFEAGNVKPAEFNHLAHLRLAYVYLVEGGRASAEQRMRQALLTFLSANGVPATKYHETLTRAWVMAVAHFMDRNSSASFAEFASNSTPLLDSKVMLTHYSSDALFSERARAAFVEPDLEAIPC